VDGTQVQGTSTNLKHVSEVGNEIGELEEQDQLKLEWQLEKLRTLLDNKQETALQGTNFQILDQELEMHLSHLNQLKIETDNI
jgi:hypothetical protein